MITILPFITDDIEALVSVSNDDDDYMKNISASRLNIPMFAFTSNKMLCNQMNLIWNVKPIFNENITNDYMKNLDIVDKYLSEQGMNKYLIVSNLESNGKMTPTIQIRTI